MLTRVHRLVALLDLLLVTTFFLATLTAEIVGDPAAVVAVKTMVLIGVCILVPCMALTGVTGRLRARNRRNQLVKAKSRRTAVIAAIGLLVLTPCAVALQRMSSAGDFGAAFRVIQAVELAGGAMNIILMSLNVRTGMILTGRVRRVVRTAATPAFESAES